MLVRRARARLVRGSVALFSSVVQAPDCCLIDSTMGNTCPGSSSSSDALAHQNTDSQVASLTKDTAKASSPPAAFAPAKVSSPSSPIASFLLITLQSASDLPAKDGPLLKADPFVIVTFGSTATRSHTQFNTLSPTWNETILVTITADDMQHPDHVIRFSLYDQDLSSKNDYIGRCDVPLSDLLAKESEATLELKLVPKAKVGETPGSGFVGLLKIKFACSPIDTVRSRAVSDMFSRFDRDGNGRLDAVEFAQFQSSLSTAGSSVFGRVDQNKDGWVDIAEVLSCVEQLIPDEVVADYFVKEANARSLHIHHPGQKGTALTEEQAGRGWFVSMTEWVSRDKYGAGLHVGRKADHIVVYNRAKGLLEEETIDPALAFSMKALYQTYSPTFARICTSHVFMLWSQHAGQWALDS